jgi:hypothetical protein
VKIGKFGNWKMWKCENVKIGKCENLKMSRVPGRHKKKKGDIEDDLQPLRGLL